MSNTQNYQLYNFNYMIIKYLKIALSLQICNFMFANIQKDF